jgi:hypothetical protein
MTPQDQREAYVPGCKHDVFISYSHFDDQPLAQTGWVAEFHRMLEIRLSQLLGEQPAIFRDPKLRGNDYFDDVLLNALPKVALLVTVLSPRYIKSEWCVKELEEFCRAAQAAAGLRVGDRSRIFKVIKTHVPRDKHLWELSGLTGYEFFREDPSTGRPKEFLHGSHEFWARLDDLAYDMHELLQVMCDSFAKRPADTLYLAEVTSDLEDRRDRLRRVFRDQHAVVPDRPLPLKMPDVSTQITGYLDRAKLSVHLVGEPYGVVPEGAAESIASLQTKLAKRAGFMRIIWVPPGLRPTDVRQQQFLARLREEVAGQDGVEYVESTLDEVERVVRDKLTQPLPEKPAARQSDEPPRVYIICDPADFAAMEPLSDFLYNRGLETIVPPMQGEQQALDDDHIQSLLICDAVLIYWGVGNEFWLRKKLRDLQKIAGYGRTEKFRARAVYVATPGNITKDRFRTHEAAVLRASGRVADDLASFVRAAEGGRGV